MNTIQQTLANIATSNVRVTHVSQATENGYVLNMDVVQDYLSFNAVQTDVNIALRMAGHRLKDFTPAAAYMYKGVLKVSASIRVG